MEIDFTSVYIAGQVLKKLLETFPDKVDGQQKIADKKAKLIYAALEKYPDSYKVCSDQSPCSFIMLTFQIVPDKSARSRMNICFRVTHVC